MRRLRQRRWTTSSLIDDVDASRAASYRRHPRVDVSDMSTDDVVIAAVYMSLHDRHYIVYSTSTELN